jgi:hypothetical protein
MDKIDKVSLKDLAAIDSSKERAALPYFADWLATSMRGKVSPAMVMCPDLKLGKVVRNGTTPPEGYIKAITLTKELALYVPPTAMEKFRASLRLYGKTVGKIAKYVSSYVMANTANRFSLGDLSVMVMPGNWPKKMDGLFFYLDTLRDVIGKKPAVMRVGFATENIPEGATATLFPGRGLVKGRGIPLPAACFPPGIAIITSEVKSELQWPGLENEAIAWQPGEAMKVKTTSTLSLQSILQIFGKAAIEPEFKAAIGDYLDHAKTRPEAILEDSSRLADDFWEDNADIENEELTRNDALENLFTTAGISMWTTPLTANSLLGKVNKSIRPGSLTVMPVSAKGSDLWTAYPTMLPWGMLADAWLACGLQPPEWLQDKANEQAKLQDVNADGKVRLYMTPALYKVFTGRSKAVAYRNPAGSKSGTVVEICELPGGLAIDPREKSVYAKPTTKAFDLLWAANEGGDLDDCFWFLLNDLADLAERGLAWRNEYQATDVNEVKAFTRDKLREVAALRRTGLGTTHLPFTAEILGSWYEVTTTLSPEEPTPGTVVETRVTGIAVRPSPKETKIPQGLLETEVEALQAKLFDEVFNLGENPFDRAVGAAANAQMFAMALAIGWVRLPNRIRRYQDLIARALMRAMLSDIVDASVKGEGYGNAWRELRRIYGILTWIDLEVRTDSAGLVVYPPLTRRCSVGMRAMMLSPKTLYATAEVALDGKPVYKAATDEKGRHLTLLSPERLGTWNGTARRFVYEGPYDAWSQWVVWLKAWAQAQASPDNSKTSVALLQQILIEEVGGNTDLPLRNAAHTAVRDYFGPAMEKVKERIKLLDTWRVGHIRSKTENFDLSWWAQEPTRQAFRDMFHRYFPMAVKRHGEEEAPGAYGRLLLALCLQFLREIPPLQFKSVGGELKCYGGIPSPAFFTDLTVGDEIYMGPWTPFFTLLRKRIVVEGIRTTNVVMFRLGKSANGLDPVDFIGADIRQILSQAGTQVAFGADSSGGRSEQAPTAAAIALMLNPYTLKGDRKTTLVDKLKGKTQWEQAEILGHAAHVSALIPGKAAMIVADTTPGDPTATDTWKKVPTTWWTVTFE